jgi:hypothetical protein
MVCTHQIGGDTPQLAALLQFATEGSVKGSVTLICGDFNEDFGEEPLLQVRKTPSGPRTWANFSLL